MPPRTTQKSCRPRVSDRIIVGTLANASACEASGPEGVEPSRHETLEWKPSTGLVSLEYLAISRQPRQKILRDRDGAGCKGQHLCPLGGDREHFFLDISFYRTTYKTRVAPKILVRNVQEAFIGQLTDRRVFWGVSRPVLEFGKKKYLQSQCICNQISDTP